MRAAPAFVSTVALLLTRPAAAYATSPAARLPSPRTCLRSGAAASAFTSAPSAFTHGSGRRNVHGPTMATSLKDLSGLKAIDGSEIPPSALNGKVVLAVNVASACGKLLSPFQSFSPESKPC